jgi:hypothetical protein
MSEITVEELEKAARNIERISAFIGERRDWIVGEGGEADATAIRGSARSLATKLIEKSGVDPDPDLKLEFPPKLEPTAKISAARLSKFADFLDQLQAWFSTQNDAEIPEGCSAAVQSVHTALAQVCAAIDSLLTLVKTPETPPPKVDDLIGEIDDLPVFDVDLNARLVLEDLELKPLLQTFKGVTELTVGAKETLEKFLAKQNVTIEGHDLRRLHDKMLKWIEGIPLGQVLVIKLSGLTGKPNIYSSYQPKGGIPAKQQEEEEDA